MTRRPAILDEFVFFSSNLTSVHPETPFLPSPLRGEGRVGVIMVQNFELFCLAPPHPNPLPPRGEGVSGWTLTISMSPDPVLFIRACPARAAPHRSCSMPQNQPGIIAGGVGEDTEP